MRIFGVVHQAKLDWPGQAQNEAPSGEYQLVFTDGAEVTTGALPCKPENLDKVTHINLWHNDVSRIEGLAKYPNLLRLTLRSNDLSSLRGVEEARYATVQGAVPTRPRVPVAGADAVRHATARVLRWLDVSSNDIKDFSGMATMKSLEWLNIENNDVSSLAGAWLQAGGDAPTLTIKCSVCGVARRVIMVPGVDVRELAPQRLAELGRSWRVPCIDEA